MLLLLSLASLLYSANALTKCQELSSQADGGLLGAFVPQCKADGSFESMQCWGSTGYCWCVDEFGKEVLGTKVRGQADCSKQAQPTLCQYLQAIVINIPGSCGPPNCKPDGVFEEVQCCASTGECYCVTRDGKEVQGTRIRGRPVCQSTHTKCEAERLQSLSNGQMVGAFVPHCLPDGSYSPTQCWASTGYCWCVDKSGNKLDGTEIRGQSPSC